MLNFFFPTSPKTEKKKRQLNSVAFEKVDCSGANTSWSSCLAEGSQGLVILRGIHDTV